MLRMVHNIWLRYGAVIVFVAVATLLSVVLRPQLEYTRSIFFIPAVIVSAWVCGFIGGALATILSTLAIDYYLVPPYGSITSSASDVIRVVTFLSVAIAVTWLTAKRRSAEDALHQANQNKSEFLNILAHELRNPLSPIRNAAEMLRRAPNNEQLIERQREIIERQVNQMARLLDDLLDVSRLGLGKVNHKPIRLDLREVASHCVEAAKLMVSGHGQELSYAMPAEPVWVEGDGVRLEQIIGNLINNASKYSDHGGHIQVTVTQERKIDGYLCAVVSVHDNGIGMAPELLPHVFSLYKQDDRAVERTRGGLGIGLALVKGLVEMHGGSVEAHSRGIGHGSTFTVRLPLLPIQDASQITVSNDNKRV